MGTGAHLALPRQHGHGRIGRCRSSGMLVRCSTKSFFGIRDFEHRKEQDPSISDCSVGFKMIKYCKSIPLVKFFKVAIEITDIDARAWWFWACDSCVKLTKPNGNIFACTGAQCTCIKGSRRYIINAFAKDINPVTEGEDVMRSFAFFGTQGKRLTGQDEDVVYASTEETTDGLPPAIANVIGKKYLVTGRVTQEIYAGDIIPFRVAGTEVIDSPVQLPPAAPAVEEATASEGAQMSPQSPHIEPGKSSASIATPPREVIEEYGSDLGEDVSSTSDKRKRKSKNVPPSSAKKQINKNLFAKK